MQRAARRIDQLRLAQKETVGLAKGGEQYKPTGLSDNPVVPTLAQQGIDKNLARRARNGFTRLIQKNDAEWDSLPAPRPAILDGANQLGANLMPDFSAITAIASSLNAAINVTKAMKDLNDWSVLQSKVIELQSAILEAQSSVFEVNSERSTLIERIGQLEKEMADLKTWETEKQRYELKAIPGGAFAYALKQEAQGAGPPHYICANCYEHHKKSVLQMKATNIASSSLGLPTQYRCLECRSEIPA
jgi:hypothetical protein